MKDKTITIHENLATFESGETSSSLAFFASLSDGERLDILECARLALLNEIILDQIDMDFDFASHLREKVSNFME